tara:strand:- start:15 stop:371 length:357 start_codon:yes stop_codon:yes gene_type:complete
MYDEDIHSETVFNFKKEGINRSQTRLLKRANDFQTIDLHGLTQNEARQILSTIFAQPHKQILKIIHGKGQHNPDAIPVLKIMTYNFLKNEIKVLAFCSAKPNDGGAGVTYVLTKKEDL